MTLLGRSLLLVSILVQSIFLHAQAPAGYYTSANGLYGESLQEALHNIIDNHTSISYTAIWTAFATTDLKPSTNIIFDMYSDIPGGTPPYQYTYSSDQCSSTPGYEGACYNREHSFPQSWFGGSSPMYTDIHQVIPSDSYVNSRRSNYPYGEVSNPTWTSDNGSKVGPCVYPGYTGTAFEPIDAYKGDVARIYLYMAVRYYGEDATWTGSAMVDGAQPLPWALNLLLDWHEADPVDAKEVSRNNAVFAIQGNRNPFIDNPDYAADIWQQGLLDEPDNHASDFSSHTITLTWEDAIGETLPDGYIIKISALGFAEITNPVDGIDEANGTTIKKVFFGTQSCTFGGLSSGQTYYFKMFPFTGTGNHIDYKTDGSIQQISLQAN